MSYHLLAEEIEDLGRQGDSALVLYDEGERYHERQKVARAFIREREELKEVWTYPETQELAFLIHSALEYKFYKTAVPHGQRLRAEELLAKLPKDIIEDIDDNYDFLLDIVRALRTLFWRREYSRAPRKG